MRSLFIALLFLSLATPLLAQEQERKLYDRITKPNMTLEYNPGGKAIGSRSYAAKSAASKTFNFKQKTSPGEFRSKQFAGSKGAWMGDAQFSTKQANTRGKYAVPNATTNYGTKTMDVVDAREASKAMPTREYAGQRPFLKRGPSQDRFDKEGPAAQAGKAPGWSGEMRPLSIDDIRELLNKNE